MRITSCRLCKDRNLISFLDLGVLAYTGIFPGSSEEIVPDGRLLLGLCESCSLVQLMDSYESHLMYGENYGYRSGLNSSMKKHLERISGKIRERLPEKQTLTIVDIGSNDGTFLDFFPSEKFRKIGIDPTISKFERFYQNDIIKVADFFSKEVLSSATSEKVNIISSIAMMYDLEDPLKFAADIYQSLEHDGIWFFEQSYLGLMLERLAYDTICHEHLEYYSAQTISEILDTTGFVVTEFELNDINGGSIAIWASKKRNSEDKHCSSFQKLLVQESIRGISTLENLQSFAIKVASHREDIKSTLGELRRKGFNIVGLGASTKGNVMLQYCDITASEISCIGEVNTDKFGKFTPGTHIPILPEEEVLSTNPDYIIIGPWHFRETFELKTVSVRESGSRVIFPLPNLEIV